MPRSPFGLSRTDDKADGEPTTPGAAAHVAIQFFYAVFPPSSQQCDQFLIDSLVPFAFLPLPPALAVDIWTSNSGSWMALALNSSAYLLPHLAAQSSKAIAFLPVYYYYKRPRKSLPVRVRVPAINLLSFPPSPRHPFCGSTWKRFWSTKSSSIFRSIQLVFL